MTIRNKIEKILRKFITRETHKGSYQRVIYQMLDEIVEAINNDQKKN